MLLSTNYTVISLIWMGCISMVLITIARIVFNQIVFDLHQENTDNNQDAVVHRNPLKESVGSARENTVYVYLRRYMSLLAVVFSLSLIHI